MKWQVCVALEFIFMASEKGILKPSLRIGLNIVNVKSPVEMMNFLPESDRE